jgi:hypothetical protein
MVTAPTEGRGWLQSWPVLFFGAGPEPSGPIGNEGGHESDAGRFRRAHSRRDDNDDDSWTSIQLDPHTDRREPSGLRVEEVDPDVGTLTKEEAKALGG